ncbi:SPOR domain-containing protein [Methylobacillus flagellatus]|uniref:SPOR domain-containing protein n=1 Tax=Methylobacillus flagellatus TaxID=405 RepID=UPI0010F5CD7D|nr:SPOR domain-containing protein [Methylobacillus flagellatus]
MSRDYKPVQRRAKPSGGSPLMTGLLLGVLLGVGLSLGVALYIKGSDIALGFRAPSVAPPVTQPAKPVEAEPEANESNDKPRFDFYTILPGSEKAVSEQEILEAQQAATPPVADKKAVSLYLQVGAYKTAQEADNMKAKLALQGMEVVVQTADIPGKGILHRVRLGPYNDLVQANQAKSELERNGFSANIIKVDAN